MAGARQPRFHLVAAMFTMQTPLTEVLTVVRQQPVTILADPGARPINYLPTIETR
jgi:hypothetical protein